MTNIDTAVERQARIRVSRPNMMNYEDDVKQLPPIYTPSNTLRHTSNAAWFEGRDIAAGLLASLMMLAPLTAYAVGWGA